MKEDDEYWTEAAALSAMILGPVASELKAKRLLIVSEGVLQYVPFAALPKPTNLGHPQGVPMPLIAEHEIVSSPSASLLAVLRREGRGRRSFAKTLAVFADPVFDEADERLRAVNGARRRPYRTPVGHEAWKHSLIPNANPSPGLAMQRLRFSRQEAEKILALVPEGQTMQAMGFEANREAAKSAELARCRIVHFATHGVLNSERPEMSGILLSMADNQGRPRDGFLRMQDIYNLNVPADLVVLSGCSTGLGKDIKGEGLIGLTRGFLYAGARRVVVSLWDVNDEATAELMARFYRGMLETGLQPGAALRIAQVSMFNEPRWRAPYYWAAFILQGDWK